MFQIKNTNDVTYLIQSTSIDWTILLSKKPVIDGKKKTMSQCL